MGRLLQFIWVIKTFLTGASAWRYCSDTILSPFCVASSFYTIVLIAAIFVRLNQKDAITVLEEQETLRIRQIEEGLETFVPVKQNGSIWSSVWARKFKREDVDKEKYS